MKAFEDVRPSKGRGSRLRVGVAALAAAVLAACTGENLFSLAGTISQLIGPEVEITAPQSGFAMAVGDSVRVTVNVTSSDGVSELSYRGAFQGGGTAFTEVVVTLPNPQDTTVSRYLKQSGTATGNASIIVQATDILGETGADTVSVVIGG